MALTLWSDSAGAAKVLTTSYVASTLTAYTSLETQGAAVMLVEAVIAGTTATSVKLIFDGSLDRSVWCPLYTEEVAGGQVINRQAEHTLWDTTGASVAGNYATSVPLVGWPYIRCRALRVGGSTDTTLIARAQFVGKI